MSDDRMNLEIGVDVNVTDLDQLKALRQEYENMSREVLQFAREIRAAANPLSSLGRVRAQLSAGAARAGNAQLDAERQTFADLKRRLAFEKRMAAQKRSEESSAAKRAREEQAETRRALNDQLNFSMRMVRERARADAEAERETRRQVAETAKVRDRANRKAISDAKELARVQGRAAERAARGAGQVRSGIGRVAGTAAATGAVAGYGLERAIERGVGTRAEIDEQETNLRIFNDVDDGNGGRRRITAEDIQKLRRGPAGLDQLAIGTGNTIADTLRAYNESAKAGLIDPMAQTRNILKAGSALELDPTKTTKLAGTLARNLGSKGTPDRMYRVLNAVGVGAREDPTQSNEIVEGLNRAQGVLAMSKGITPEDLVAMVSGNQSVGIQPGKAGTTISALFSSVLAGGSRFADPKRRKELNWAAKKLGFSSGRDMAQKLASESGKATYYQILSGLKGMPEQLRQQVASAISGNQWSDEDLQIVNGLDGQIKTDQEIHDPRNARFIDEAAATKMQSWRMLWQQSQTIFSLFWESFGRGFDEVLREVNGFFLDLNGKFRYDDVTSSVKQALDGLKSGLGFETWGDALKAMFPSNLGNVGKQIGQFAKGFGSAMREIGGAVTAVARMFGGSGGAESIGRLTAQFLSLGAAAVVLSPVLGVIGGVTSIVLGLANVARAAAGVLGLGAGAAAGGGAVAGAMTGIARLLSGGFVLSLAGAIGNLRGEISTLVLNAVRPLISAIWSGLREAFSIEGLKAGGRAVLDEMIPAPLKRWLESGTPDQGKAEGSRWSDPPMRKPVEQLRDSVEQNVDALHEGARVQRQSLKAMDDFRSLIHKASLNTEADSVVGSIRSGAARAGSPLSGSLGGGGGGGDPAGAGGSGVGSVGGNGVANPNLSGDVAARAKEAHDFFRAQGYSEEATAGILASLKKESNFTPTSRGDGGAAHGIAQWHADRRRQILAGTGIDVSRASFSDQLRAIDWEMKHGDAGAQRARRLLMTPNISARDAGGAFVQHFERPLRDERAERGALAEGFHRQFGGGSSGSSAGAPGGGNNPADVAAGYLGKGEYRDRPTVERFVGHSIRGAANAWCARFVNASLAAVGQTGTGSAIANSYLRWGREISAEMVQKGDVLVEHRGRGVDGMGGHVGFSTGRTRRGRDGQLELEMLGGNTNDQVATSWEKASSLAVRRGAAAQAQASAQGITAAAQGGQGPVGVAANQPGNVSAQVPIRPQASAGGGGGQGGGGQPIHAPITINGAGQSPEELAAKVQKHLQDSMNRRTHDYDGFA